MDDVLKQARKHLEGVDLEKLEKSLRDVDWKQFDTARLKKSQKNIKKKVSRKRAEEQSRSEGFVGGILMGIVVGAILALIFAPKSGAETRQQVSRSVDDIKDKMTSEAEAK